jgi:hypothetical protein
MSKLSPDLDMHSLSSTRPGDANQRARLMGDPAMGSVVEPTVGNGNNAAIALGRLGGEKWGRTRAEGRTSEERHRTAAKAARARWARPKDGER